jgi:hypothetical protein
MIIPSVCMGWLVCQSDSIAIITPVLFVVFQVSLGVLFIRSKRRILHMLSEAKKMNDFHNSEKLRDLRRMSFFLYVSSFFMFAYVVTLLLPGYGVMIGSSEFIVYSSWLTELFNALSELSQILSLPQKITGIEGTFWDKTSSAEPIKNEPQGHHHNSNTTGRNSETAPQESSNNGCGRST